MGESGESSRSNFSRIFLYVCVWMRVTIAVRQAATLALPLKIEEPFRNFSHTARHVVQWDNYY